MYANNKALLEQIKISRLQGRPTNALGAMFISIVDGYSSRWKRIYFVDEMQSDAIVTLCTYWHKFNDKFTNPFAYYTSLIHNSFLKTLNRHHRDINTRNELRLWGSTFGERMRFEVNFGEARSEPVPSPFIRCKRAKSVAKPVSKPAKTRQILVKAKETPTKRVRSESYLEQRRLSKALDRRNESQEQLSLRLEKQRALSKLYYAKNRERFKEYKLSRKRPLTEIEKEKRRSQMAVYRTQGKCLPDYSKETPEERERRLSNKREDMKRRRAKESN